MGALVEGMRGLRDSQAKGDAKDHSQEFGVEGSPFDDSFSAYYPVKQWEEHLRYLQRYRAGSHPLLLIPGIVGSGKTALIKRFLDWQNDPARVHYIEAQPHHAVNHLMQTLYSGSRLEARSDASIPEVLHQLSLLAKEVGSQLLFIDDAHRLPRETLMRLLHLLFSQDLEQSQYRVVLSGESQLQETVMNMLDTFAAGRQVPNLEIEPFSQQEVREYLEFRFAQTQSNQKFPFNTTVLKQIHLLSGGFPGRVNRVAQQVYVDSMRFNHHSDTLVTRSHQLLQGHKMKLVGATFFVALFLLVWQFQPAHQKGTADIAALRSAVNAVAEKSHQESEQASAAESTAETVDAVAANGGQLSQDVHEAIAAAVNHIQAVELSEAEQYEESFSMPLVHNQHLCAGARLADEAIYLADKSATKTETVAQASPSVISPTASATLVTMKAPKVELKTTAVLSSARMAVADSISGAELQLMAAKGFTIQIMGVRAPQLLETFIAENHLSDATYYRTKLNHQDWYVLVYGNYPSSEEAKAALAKLPEEVRRQQPWVRSVDGVRQAIEVAHQKEMPKEQQRVAVR